MGHPDEGMIRAFMDGEASGPWQDLGAHLTECPQCAALAEGQVHALETLVEVLSCLDVEPAMERARARVLEKEAESRRLGVILRRNIPRAASFVVLLTAGTAFALPGSPLREWLARTWETASGPGKAAPEASPAPAGATTAPEMVGATIPATSDGIELTVLGLPEGSSVRVVLVEGDRAGIFAGEGTRFRSEARRLVASEPPGDITMEIPRGATLVSVVVNGELYLRKTGEGLELLGPVRNRTPTEIRFGPSDRGANPPSSDG
jgi:hypothetical protein